MDTSSIRQNDGGRFLSCQDRLSFVSVLFEMVIQHLSYQLKPDFVLVCH